ncbi:MAG: thiol:disulfide interchange protein DsbA/DsbL [Moraxellaceae bacterium]
MTTQFHPVLFAVAILPAVVWLTGCSQPESTATAADAASSSPAASTSTPAPESPSAAATETPPTTPSELVEGRDYTVIKTPLNVEKPDQIEVREFFWYGCSHCYALEPSLNNWLASKPADVNFIRTPAALNPVWEQNARAYYTVEGMGKMTSALHDQLFSTIHQQQKQLFDQPSLADFYGKAGVDVAAFNSAYNSFAVTTKINQSKQLAQHAGLSGVPALVVNGQYLVGGEPQQVIRTLNGLIEQERQALAASTR